MKKANIYPLRSLFWEATLACNAFCRFCGSRCTGQQSERELKTEEICAALRQIAEDYDAEEIMLNVTGGEPLLRKDLFEVTAYARSLGFHWGIVTNGLLLSDMMVRRLMESGCETASISLDGMAAVHDELRGVAHGFEKTVDGIRRLGTEPGMECLMVTTVVSKANLSELSAIRDFLKTLPIHIWRVCPVDPIGRADADEKQLLDAAELKEMLAFIKESQSLSLPYRVTTSCSHYFGKRDMDVHDWPFFCATGKQIASILANGDIYVCPNVPRVPSLIQGNVRTDRFSEVWEKGFEFFREDTVRYSAQCRECPVWEDCRGDSTHTWDFENRRPKVCAAKLGLLEEQGGETGSDLFGNSESDYPVCSFDQLIDDYKKRYGDLQGLFAEGEPGEENCAVFSPDATKDTFRLMASKTEQIVCLLGYIYRDENRDPGLLYHVQSVREIQPIYASPTELLADKSILLQARRHLAEETVISEKSAGMAARRDERSVCSKPRSAPIEIIGFLHTHPGDLDVAMSSGDYDWHCDLIRSGMNPVSIIFNPQRQTIAAYTGLHANLTELHMLTDGE